MIEVKTYKENIHELLKVIPEKDIEASVSYVCGGYLKSYFEKQPKYRLWILPHTELTVTADGFDGVTPNFSTLARPGWNCDFIIYITYNKLEKERRREIAACFHQDDDIKEAFLFNFEEDRLYRFTRQPDSGFIEEECSYSRRFQEDIRHYFGTSLEVMEKSQQAISLTLKDMRKKNAETKRPYKEQLKYLLKILEKEKYVQYALQNNFESDPITQDVHAWYSKRIYDKLSSEILNNKDFKKELLFTNAPVYSDSTGTLRTDIATFKYVLKPEDGNCPTFKYALWAVSIVGEEGLKNAQKKMDDILKKVVTINEAFLFDPMTKKWMRYTRQEDDSVIVEEKSYSRYLQKYMGSLL